MGFGGGSRAALRPPYSYEGFRARRVSGGLRPSPYIRRGAPGAGRCSTFYACDASIYRCDAGRCPIPQRETRGRGFSRRRAGASRHGAWPHGKLRNAGRASESTGAAQDGGCAATPSIAVRFASTHSDGHLLLLVLDLMLLGRCSVDGPSLALGSHARLS